MLVGAIARPLPAVALPAASVPTASVPVLGTVEARPLRRQPSTNRQARRRRPRPPRRLPPNRVQPGGGLDVAAQSCDPSRQPLTALVPMANPVFTASAHPTFLFHLTDEPEQVERIEFMLLSADEKEQVYATQFEPTQAGITSISLPADPDYALEPEQAYHWYLNLYCKSGSAVLAVDGWVQRLGEGQSAAGTDESGLPVVWYDAIAQLAAELASGESPGLAIASQAARRQEWELLLSTIGLESVATAPIVGAATTPAVTTP